MDNLSKLSERIKELAFECSVKMTELATALGVKPSTLYRYVNGERTPSFQNFIKLLEYFNCSADFLLGLTDYPPLNTTYLPAPAFSTRFRYLLDTHAVTQYALHKKTGFSYDNFSKWLNGVTSPYADNLIKLAKAFDCTVDYLIGRTDG